MLPETARAWERLTRVAQELFARYGYEPIYTPIFEHTEVFTRGIGEATDIVGKEMYTFEDRSGRSLTLRPEGTASVVRAALEHSLAPRGSSLKLYYAGPMFRYERPQKGRARQFWQIGAEILGADGPGADAEVIVLLWRLYQELGIPAASLRLLLNSMGDEACRPAYRERVAEYIRSHATEVCDECVRRLDANPLRAFDCKNVRCAEVMAGAPLLRDELCRPCAEHYAGVKTRLDTAGIGYAEAPRLVRGLDYYTRTVFEVQADAGLGAQNAIGGGGRYDGLMEVLGGKPTPGLGWALGFERTLLAMQAAHAETPTSVSADVYVAYVDEGVAETAFAIATGLRDAGISAALDHSGRSLKAQFKQADRYGVRIVVIAGPDELAAGEVTLRDMSTKEEARVSRAQVVAAVRQALG